MLIQIKFTVLVFWTVSCFQSSAVAQSFISVAAPNNAEVTPGSVTATSMWITWEAVPKADSYTVSIKPPSIGADGIGSGILETNSIISGLVPNREYQITIRAVQGDYEGNPAVVAQTTALPSPTDVWAVSDSVSQDSMEIVWTPVDGAQSYTVEVNPSAGIGGGGRGLFATNVRLRGMSPNTLYTINVYAVNWVGNGAKATLKQFTKLGPPKDLIIVRATVSPTAIGVQWSETVGAHNYVIRITPSNRLNSAIPRVRDPRYVIRNLEPDTQYKIEVAASNAAGPSAFSIVNQRTLSVCFATADSFRDETFTLRCPPRCSRIQSQVFGTREYSIDSYVCAAAIHDGRLNDNVGGTVVVKKRPGILDFVGTAKNGILSKDYKSFHRSFVFALQSPENVRTQPGSVFHDRFTVMWNEVSGAAAYRVTVDPPEGVLGIDSNIEDTRVTLRGLRNNTIYRVYVSAVNRVETSDGTTILQRTALPAPKNFQILPNTVFYDRFTVAWDAMGVGTGLRYQVTLLSDGRRVLTVETVVSSYTALNLTSGTMYNVSVQALNEIGLGQATWISQYTALQKPVHVVATMFSSHSMRLQWDRVTGAKYYHVYIPQISMSVNVTDPVSLVENLQADTLYNISIIAVNDNDESGATWFQKRTRLSPPEIYVDFRSLTHTHAFLTWHELRNASYVIQIFSIDKMDTRNLTTEERVLNLTGLRERTEYVVNIVGINEVGFGENETTAFKTLTMPPSNLAITLDDLQLGYGSLKWDKIPDVSSYFLSCSPSADMKGVGVITETSTRLSGLSINVRYTISLMGMNGEDNGVNSTVTFVVELPQPKVVVMHSITDHSLVLQWNPKNFDISTISYNTSKENRISVKVKEEDKGKLFFNGLRSNMICQFNIFSHSLAQYVSRDGVERPVTTQSVMIGFGSNMTDVIVFWPKIKYSDPINYLLATSPRVENGPQNITSNSVSLTGLKMGMTYSVAVATRHVAMNITTNHTVLRIEQKENPMDETDLFYNIGGGTDEGFNFNEIDLFIDEQPTFVFPDELEESLFTHNIKNIVFKLLNPLNKRHKTSTETPTLPYTPNLDITESGDNENKQSPEQTNSMWIPIVIIVVCVVVIAILIAVPCLCGCGQNKPILRNNGFCGCCYSHPAEKHRRTHR